MDITPQHVAYRKKVGMYEGRPVWEIATTGGYHLLVGLCKGTQKTFGVGSHKCIARHIARKRTPGLELTELSKADQIDPRAFAHLIPTYEAETDRFNALEARLYGSRE